MEVRVKKKDEKKTQNSDQKKEGKKKILNQHHPKIHCQLDKHYLLTGSPPNKNL